MCITVPHCAGCDRPVHELRGGTDDPADHTPARLRVREGKLPHEFPCGKRYVRAHRPRRSVHGVYNYELCAAYASIANGGTYNTPTLYTKILDHDGNVLIENPTESHQSVKESTAALLTSAMQSVVQEGSGRAAALDNMPVAGKTGTADNDKDIWFCGFTPYYTCAVWGGYDDPKSMSNIDTTSGSRSGKRS